MLSYWKVNTHLSYTYIGLFWILLKRWFHEIFSDHGCMPIRLYLDGLSWNTAISMLAHSWSFFLVYIHSHYFDLFLQIGPIAGSDRLLLKEKRVCICLLEDQTFPTVVSCPETIPNVDDKAFTERSQTQITCTYIAPQYLSHTKLQGLSEKDWCTAGKSSASSFWKQKLRSL